MAYAHLCTVRCCFSFDFSGLSIQVSSEPVFLLQTGHKLVGTPQFMQIYRSREVGQSYITSVWTTLVAMAHSLWLMIRVRPEVVLFFPSSSFIL